jgi:hypothetical protein
LVLLLGPGGNKLGSKGGIEVKYLNRAGDSDSENLEASLLKFCSLGINPSVNVDIGHDVMCPGTINGMIILRDDVVKAEAVEVDEVTEE